MSVAALVRQVGEVLARRRALFGDASAASGPVAARLPTAGQLVVTAREFAPLAGDFAASYRGSPGRPVPCWIDWGCLPTGLGK